VPDTNGSKLWWLRCWADDPNDISEGAKDEEDRKRFMDAFHIDVMIAVHCSSALIAVNISSIRLLARQQYKSMTRPR
jgi:hypothetical protein